MVAIKCACAFYIVHSPLVLMMHEVSVLRPEIWGISCLYGNCCKVEELIKSAFGLNFS